MKKSQKNIIVRVIIIWVGCFLLIGGHCAPSREVQKRLKKQKVLSIEILEPVRVGLKRYYEENKRYPYQLDDLIPKYLEEKPNGFDYQRPLQGDLEGVYFVYAQKYDLYLYSKFTEDSDWQAWNNLNKLFSQALHEFYSETKHYPTSLDELYPKYIEKKPTDLLKSISFSTEINETDLYYKNNYFLKFESDIAPPGPDSCYLNMQNWEWECSSYME